MPEELCNELLASLDFEYNRVRSRMIEQMMPRLMGMVENELRGLPNEIMAQYEVDKTVIPG